MPSTKFETLDSWSERGTDLHLVNFSIRHHGGLLSLHAGDIEWRLNDQELSFSFLLNDSLVTSCFSVSRARRQVFSFRYLHPCRTLFAKLDATYDYLDFVRDHKLFWVAENALSPQWQDAYLQRHRRNSEIDI